MARQLIPFLVIGAAVYLGAAQTPTVWPGERWPMAAPASQGLDGAAFDAIDRDVRAGIYGHVDRLLVIRSGLAVFDRRYPRDYAAISRGRQGPLGCGDMLLSGIITAVTGRFLDDYAAEHLFRPIGIRDFHWKKTPTGHPDTEGGLYLAAEGLARIGYLYVRDGQWDGRRILPAEWVRKATTPHTKAAGGWEYGYQWWLTSHNGDDVWAGRGFGGQLLVVVPGRDVVIVALAWNVFGTPARNVLTPLLHAVVN